MHVRPCASTVPAAQVAAVVANCPASAPVSPTDWTVSGSEPVLVSVYVRALPGPAPIWRSPAEKAAAGVSVAVTAAFAGAGAAAAKATMANGRSRRRVVCQGTLTQKVNTADCDHRDTVSTRVPSAEAHRRIVAAAGRLLEDRRFRELTVESVMAEAGLARTVFYRHFDSLADVVVCLLDEEVEASVQTAPDGLHAMLARSVDLYARHGHLLAAVEEASHHDAGVERVYRDAFEASVQATVALVGDRSTARALMHLNAGYLTDALARDPHGDREEALRTLWAIWSRVLST